jgi:3-phosphoshikimate 1-carboxyvinyltransferase
MPGEAYGYPEKLEMVPLAAAPKTVVSVPGSKSMTNRALLLAALGSKQLRLLGALRSEDTEVMIDSLRRLGFNIQMGSASDGEINIVHPRGGTKARTSADLFVANSGTTMRFLTALVALWRGRFRIDGNQRMRERPILELLDGLRQLGVDAISEHANGCPPVIVNSTGLSGGRVQLQADRSSQFLSALLLVCPFAIGLTRIEVTGPMVSEPYVDLTVAMLRQFGLECESLPGSIYRIAGKQKVSLEGDYRIEPDASAASYFFAAAAITGGAVTVAGLSRKSLQGDVRFVEVLQQMGSRVEECESGITVHGRSLRGVDVDMNGISDTVMTLASVACFAQGPTTIRNVAHIRHKESNRIEALATELGKLGAEVEELTDGLRITPHELHGAEIETYEDHRMAMSLALVGLRIPGVTIRNPACVAKTYPEFWSDLDRLRS